MLTVRPLTSAGDASNSAPKPTPSCLIATFCSCRERSSLDLRGTAASLRLPSTASFVFVNETLDLRLETPPASAGPPPPPAVTLVPFSASVDSAARTPKPEAPFSITTLPPLIVREPDFVTSSPLTPEPDWFSSSMSSSVNPAPVSAMAAPVPPGSVTRLMFESVTAPALAETVTLSVLLWTITPGPSPLIVRPESPALESVIASTYGSRLRPVRLRSCWAQAIFRLWRLLRRS
jgi:hypothetical protein